MDGAFVIIAWVGLKLCWEYFHDAGYVHLEIPQWFSLTVIVLIFAAAYAYARAQGPVETSAAGEDAEHILEGEAAAIAATDGTVEK